MSVSCILYLCPFPLTFCCLTPPSSYKLVFSDAFVVQKHYATTTVSIKLPIVMPATHMTALPSVCVQAPNCFEIMSLCHRTSSADCGLLVSLLAAACSCFVYLLLPLVVFSCCIPLPCSLASGIDRPPGKRREENWNTREGRREEEGRGIRTKVKQGENRRSK